MSTRSFAAPSYQRRVEERHSFPCFGGQCTVIVADAARPQEAAAAAGMARSALMAWHERFSRFQDGSEISRLNADPRSTVDVSPLLARMIEVGLRGARDTGGLVDATLGQEIVGAGYGEHFAGDGISLAVALAAAPPRAPAGPHPGARWRRVSVDRGAQTVTRPPGLAIDVGGVAKGVFADELASMLDGFDAYAVDCAGDVRVGGAAGIARDVQVSGPFDGEILHTFALRAGAVATSGIGKRSWMRPDGRPAHHLLDAGTGEPAFTGIVQATAVAPTAAQAEVLAKAAVLGGPARAGDWLTYGGLIVLDDGGVRLFERPRPARASSSTAGAAVSFRSG